MVDFIANRFKNLMCMEEPDGGGGEPTNTTPTSPNPSDATEEKTFTQEQVNSMIAQEKRKQVSAAYKSMGFESEEEAKTWIDKYRAQEEAAKSDLEKAQAQVTALEAQNKAQAQATQDLEHKFVAIEAGCPASSAGDVVTLAKSKMTDEKDFAAALEEVKTQYPAMFGNPTQNIGASTGSGGNPPRSKVNAGNVSGIGKRLAEEKAKQMGVNK